MVCWMLDMKSNFVQDL